jgi:hypothetical protein
MINPIINPETYSFITILRIDSGVNRIIPRIGIKNMGIESKALFPMKQKGVRLIKKPTAVLAKVEMNKKYSGTSIIVKFIWIS